MSGERNEWLRVPGKNNKDPLLLRTVLQSNEECLLQGSSDAERARIQREEASYRQDMNKLDKDLW